MGHTHEAPAETTGLLIRQAVAYDALVGTLMLGRAGRLRRRIAEIVPVRPGAAILDVGCGTGDLALTLARRLGGTGSVVGIDASPEMIARARGKARRAGLPVEFRVAAAEALPFADGSFDLVVSSLVLHHLPGDLKQRALASMARALKPDGTVTIVDFLTPEGYIQRHGASSTDSGSLSNWLRAAGFTDVRGEPLRFRSLGELLGWPPLSVTQAHLPEA